MVASSTIVSGALGFGLIPSVSGANPTPKTVIAVNPHSIVGIAPGSSISFSVNVTNAPSLSSFDVALTYNASVLHITSLDTSGSVFSPYPDVRVITECIPDLAIYCSSSDNFELFTVLLYGEKTSPSTNSTSGTLFKLNFNVINSGFALIHIRLGLLATPVLGVASLVPSTDVDGYFTNITCGSPSHYCTPAVPGFKLSPFLFGANNVTEVVAGRRISFDASSSNTTNPGATIASYSWDWGTGAVSTVTNSNITHTYAQGDAGGLISVTLTVRDSYGIPGSASVLIKVIRIWTDMVMRSVTANPTQRVLPGSVVTVTVDLQNQSINPENASVITRVGSVSLGNRTFTDLRPDQEFKYSFPWSTEGLGPKDYLISVFVAPVLNSTTGQIIENVTTNNFASVFVEVVEPLPSGYGLFLGLGLFTTAGVGLVVAAGIGGSISLLRRRKPLPSLEV